MSVLLSRWLAFRALERSEVVGVLYEWVVGVLVALSVFNDEEWRWVRCWGLIGVCGINVVCVVLGDVVGRVRDLSGWMLGCLHGV